jgi:hypothetical protein
MAVTDYSITPASNTSISGVNIAEGCAPGSINDAIRQLMADMRVLYNGLPNLSAYAPLAGATFTGPIQQTGKGLYRLNADPSLASGLHYFLPEGTTLPSSPVEGMTVDFYAP